MKKGKQQSKKKIDDGKTTLFDHLDQDLLEKLKDKKNELKQVEQEKEQQEAERKREERRLREKNKSFEELFNESNLDWKKFK